MASCPQSWDGTSYFRAVGPLSRLKRDYPDKYFISLAEQLDWSGAKCADVILAQRPCNPEHLKLCTIVKESGTPLWIDYDDNLMAMPTEHAFYHEYIKPETKESIVSCIKLADHVTVSTPALKRAMEHLNPNITVIPNALDETLLKGYDPLSKPRLESPKVYWRGAFIHFKDLMNIKEEILSLDKEIGNLTWRFTGYNPEYITHFVKNAEYVVPMDVMKFFNFIKGQTHTVGIHPLHDCIFNHAKSNIAWIENTLSGNPCIGPTGSDFTEWNKPGIPTFSSKEEFKVILKELILSPELCKKYTKESLTYILDELTLKSVNSLRAHVIEKLLS